MIIIWVIALVIAFALLSYMWIKTAFGHRFFALLMIGVFAILNLFVEDADLLFAVASLFFIVVWVFSSNGPGIISGLLLGLESTAALVTGLSLVPFFPADIYNTFLLWLFEGGSTILMILFWPVALGVFLLVKITDY